ncbi:hypothetical protein BGZ60DRAFT_418731 [Tricladium varicosporioides]|nr:hypothetical protein BGZ60DRAFT_418731 [Hymenoscyphus varicosporioides]
MPGLLSIPREIRDEIYALIVPEDLASSKSRDLQKERKRISFDKENPDTYFGEESVRYPVHTSLPPTFSLLQTSRQIRTEIMDSLKRLGPVKYKVNFTDRRDKGTLSPTWISVPCFKDKVDVLEVHWKIKTRKTTSVFSFNGDDECENSVYGFGTCLALAQRFVERGVYLLSKKKRNKMHIGLLAMHLNVDPDIDPEDVDEFAEHCCQFLDDWMLGDTWGGYDSNAKEREEAQFRLLSGKIDRLQMFSNSVLKKEWIMEDVVVKRDLNQQEQERAAAERAASAALTVQLHERSNTRLGITGTENTGEAF